MATSDACASSGLTVEAQAWLARLPSAVRPHGMAMYAPATANRLAAIWADTGAAGDAMEDLLIAESALPHAIAAELLRLYEYHARCRSPQGRTEPAR
jgi:hypothetical protein